MFPELGWIVCLACPGLLLAKKPHCFVINSAAWLTVKANTQ